MGLIGGRGPAPARHRAKPRLIIGVGEACCVFAGRKTSTHHPETPRGDRRRQPSSLNTAQNGARRAGDVRLRCRAEALKELGDVESRAQWSPADSLKRSHPSGQVSGEHRHDCVCIDRFYGVDGRTLDVHETTPVRAPSVCEGSDALTSPGLVKGWDRRVVGFVLRETSGAHHNAAPRRIRPAPSILPRSICSGRT